MREELGLDREPLLHRQRGQVPAAREPGPLPDEIAACRPYLERPDRAHRAAGDRHPRATSPPSCCSTPARGSASCGAGSIRSRPGQPRADVPPGLRAAGGGEVVAEMRADLVRAKRLLAAGRGVTLAARAPDRRSPAADRGRRRPGAGAALRPRPATSCCSSATSAPARRPSPRGSAPAWGSTGPITSPTFTLVRQYRVRPGARRSAQPPPRRRLPPRARWPRSSTSALAELVDDGRGGRRRVGRRGRARARRRRARGDASPDRWATDRASP